MIRIILIVLAVVILTLVLLPFQLIGLAFELRLQRTIPHCYHRVICALIGVRIREVGRRSTASPALILSNHVSWLDICVITALAPVVFVAKSEVAGWPVLGWLAKLQRTIFINRQARRVAWYGNADLIPHLLHVLSSGAVDVTVSWGEAAAYDIGADRKAIARDAERSVRRMNAAALRAGPPLRAISPPAPKQPLPEPA
jgi:1-acyl-sn-glycerol-3-phosphate acyltransferase